METAAKQESIINKGIIDEKRLRGKWRLSYKVTNTIGHNGFGSRGLSTYVHPITGKKMTLIIDGQKVHLYEIMSSSTTLDPDINRNHKALVNWLLPHPEVMVDDVSLGSEISSKKNGNSKIKLVNIDFQDLTAIEDEDTIDRMVGRLSLYGGTEAIGFEKLGYILAGLGLPYEDKRYMSQTPQAKKTHTKLLRNKLKKFVKVSVENAKKVDEAIVNIEENKKVYCVKLLLDNGVITYNNGMLKYNNTALGTDIPSVTNFLSTNSEFWLEIQDKVSKILKNRG